MLITAKQIHNGHKWLPEGTVIDMSESGHIKAIYDASLQDEAVFYEGVLIPGFVNAHCHLELSHMKGAIPELTGLIPFLQTIPRHRNDFTEDFKKEARHKAFHEMLNNGIVAVGDIANTTESLDLRYLDLMHFHTFAEAIGFSETNVQKLFSRAVHVYSEFEAQQLKEKKIRQSIVPHAPYSVSHSLFRMIDAHDKSAIISIHNQESQAEDEYYFIKHGPVNKLLHGLGIDDSFFKPSGKSSLQTYLEWLSSSHPFIFIHNTFTKRNDVEIAQAYLKNVSWCFCPNANMYIEHQLPDVEMFIQQHANICIGTDSLASNHQLSILAELQTLKKHFPGLDWETLITWGTYNGACALQMDSIIGSIEPGKQPGILQLVNMEAPDADIKVIA
jgi:cytosine/adenosine deaminase-related metal-dependent hydrolase